MKKLSMCVMLAAAVSSHAAPGADPALQHAPADGWAGQEGGTHGGAAATAANIVTVSTRADLLGALARSGTASKIIKVAGVIDMSEATPFASSADQSTRGAVHVPSNTTLIGSGPNAGFINAHLHVAKATQVIIRNLHFRNPCDVGPVWDPRDGAKGNWNSLFDSITVSGSTHVWIDHNSFTDAPHTDDSAPIANGMLKQCHDGALDIGSASDLVTVSHNRFALHEKNTLIGSGDRATGDEGRLRVTLSHNLFENIAARAPRVRFGRVHLFNNYYAGDRRHAAYAHEYSVGVGKQAKIISHNNAFEIAGARNCGQVVKNPGTSPAGVFADSGSALDGQALADCPFAGDPGWSVPYAFTPLAAGLVKAQVLREAGPDAADYFIEARIRPLAQAAPGNRRVYLQARHTDPGNWVGAGLNITNGSPTVQIEIVRMQDGAISRLKQVTRALASDGRNYKLRFDVAGGMLSVYLNGERMTTVAAPFPSARGQTGVHGGDGFEVLDVRGGDAKLKPERLAVATGGSRFVAQAGDAPRTIAIAAPGPVSATSSAPHIVAVAAGDGAVVLTPKAAGSASIVVASTADPSVQTIIDASVAPSFQLPAQVYPLAGAVLPRPRARAVHPDTLLRLVFDAPPAPGNSGSVRVFRKADDALVDVIHVGEEVAALGFPAQDQRRYVRHTPIKIAGNTATIKLHSHKLAYGTEYYVAIGDGVFNGTSIGGVPFKGIGKAADWSFRTRRAAPSGATLTVDDDGPADFRTLQGALDHAMQHLGKARPATIKVSNGSYEELLFIRNKDQLTIQGESRDGVLIHATNNDSMNPGSGLSQGAGSPSHSGGRSLLMIEESDLLTLENLTLKNTTLRANSPSAQAETLYFNSDNARLVARNASFFSEQDTIQVKGYSWFYRTLIAGNVDFIWGANRVALFEESEIRSVGDSANPQLGGYVVQARTVDAGDKGFVFLNSRLTHGPGPAGNDVPPGTTYLARSPGTPSTWDNVSFINCTMDQHIAAIGWYGKPPANPALAGAASGWREFGSKEMADRIGGYTLSAAEVATHFGSRAAIFAARGWNPAPASATSSP
jgi:pectate lyase